MSGDPYFDNVSLLVHCDGTDGSTTFVDASNNTFTLTPVNDVDLDTSKKKFGTASMECTGSSLQYITTPIVASGPLDFTTHDEWTIEFWVYHTSLLRQNFLLANGTPFTSGLWIQDVNPDHYQAAIRIGGTTQQITNPQTATHDVWNHIALECHNGIVTLYTNGVGYPTGAYDSASSGHSTSQAGDTIKWGGLNNSFISNFAGWMDDLRITKGVARYQGDFTPPAAAFADGAAPSISVQPQNQSVVDPATATFSVTASGTGTLSYQWYKNGVSLGGAAQASSYTTPANDVDINNGDQYYVIVTNAIDSVQSDTVTLTVTSGTSFIFPYVDVNKPFIPLELFLALHAIRTIPGYNKGQLRTECYRAQAAGETWIRRDSFTKQYYARHPKTQ